MTDTPPTLEKMQKFVEGNIELVNVLFNGEPHHMIVNGEGAIHKMMINFRATSLYHYASIGRGQLPDWPISGPAILLDGVELE